MDSGLTRLRAGPLKACFDASRAFLRYVCYGREEIVRGIFPAVRDRDWNTIPFDVHDLQLDVGPDHFEISFRCRCHHFPFEWTSQIRGESSGRIEYLFDGMASDPLLKNRIGLCVLHPHRPCAGSACRVTHTNGCESVGEFPVLISPHQPFLDIAQLSHQVGEQTWAKVKFVGESFEMEDQRNWTDASFKTYSTPLALPFPVEMSKGQQVRHCVSVEIENAKLAANQSRGESTAPSLGTSAATASVSLARLRQVERANIGTCLSTSLAATPPQVVQKIQELKPDHLRFEIDLRLADWQKRWAEAMDWGDKVGCSIEAAVQIPALDSASMDKFTKQIERSASQLARLLLFDAHAKTTPSGLVAEMLAARESHGWRVPMAFGTNAYFAELNRQRPSVRGEAAICYSINPQVHAFDDLSVMETLGALKDTVDTAHAIFRRPIVVSPITLRPRFNPNATSDVQRDQAEIDPRQDTEFAAAWTEGVCAQLIVDPRVESVTFYEAFGPRGLMDSQANTYPVFDTLKSLLSSRIIWTSVESLPSISVLGRPVEPQPQSQESRIELSVTNFGIEDQSLEFQDDSRGNHRLQVPAMSVVRHTLSDLQSRIHHG